MHDYVAVLDTSGWQANYAGNGRLRPGALPFEFEKAKARGVQGVIHRVGNGTSLDESFALASQSCQAAELAFGAYYYMQPNRLQAKDAAALVQTWLDQFPRTQLPIMLDCEEYNGTQWSKQKLGEYIRVLLLELERLDGRKPLIYSGAWWWNSRVAGDFTSYDTMQSRYPRYGTVPPSDLAEWDQWIPWDKPPLDSPGMGEWDGWQFTSDLYGPDFGVPADAATTRLDGNVVKPEAWARWTDGAVVNPPPPPQEDPPPWPEFSPKTGQFSLWPFNVDKGTISNGAEGDAVAYLQGVIYHKAGGKIAVDGQFGPQTEGRVKDLQRFFQIAVDGVVGYDGGNGSNPGKNATWPIVDFLAGLK